MHEMTEAVEKLADYLTEHATEAEQLGRMPDATMAHLKKIGVIRMLQPLSHGGSQVVPSEFYETVMSASRFCGSTGWVCGIVGVHPWEIALCDPKLQEEIWGDDPNRWVASPYAQLGRARRVEGGYIMSGRWPFSSGTDHCEWVVLGGVVLNDDPSAPPEGKHFFLPRRDYTILDDSWNVMGLKGSGSKDVVVEEAFIPDYRVVDPIKLISGELAVEMGRTESLYRMPFMSIFMGAITAATIGIAEGALAASIAYQRGRVDYFGRRVIEDANAASTLGAAAADIDASRVQFISDMNRMYDVVDSGGTISMDMRAEVRRNQVRGSRRAVDAVDELFSRAGGGSLRLDQPFQRFWRDVHACMNHVANVADPIYLGWGNQIFGLPLPVTAFI